MKKQICIFFLAIFAIMYCSCNDEEQTAQETIKLDKHASVDVKITQIVSDTNIIVTTNKIFYDNTGLLVKTTIGYDTVPTLGLTKDTLDTGRTYKDEDGVEWPKDTVITHKKNYKFYITVK